VTDAVPHLTSALADRYRIERELDAGGMVMAPAARAAARPLPLTRLNHAHSVASATVGWPGAGFSLRRITWYRLERRDPPCNRP
jgi:hypothetical protein